MSSSIAGSWTGYIAAKKRASLEDPGNFVAVFSTNFAEDRMKYDRSSILQLVRRTMVFPLLIIGVNFHFFERWLTDMWHETYSALIAQLHFSWERKPSFKSITAVGVKGSKPVGLYCAREANCCSRKLWSGHHRAHYSGPKICIYILFRRPTITRYLEQWSAPNPLSSKSHLFPYKCRHPIPFAVCSCYVVLALS